MDQGVPGLTQPQERLEGLSPMGEGFDFWSNNQCEPNLFMP